MICIIDYDLGNVISIKNALDRLKKKNIITRDKELIKKSTHIILPGVGAFSKGMENLIKFDLVSTLNNEVILKKKKILGICLGFQLMCKESEEFGKHKGLGWLDLIVKKMVDKSVRLPHVGWNKINFLKDKNELFLNIDNDQMFYFNHSFAVYNFDQEQYSSLAKSNYENDFLAILKKNNISAIQAHPEKSQKQGLQLIENFIHN